MLNAKAAILNLENRSHDPIIDIATSYKNANKEAMLFEYGVGAGKLLVCTLNLSENDPGALWLREKIISYAMSDGFEPSEKLSVEELSGLFGRSISLGENQNLAQNKNDITM